MKMKFRRKAKIPYTLRTTNRDSVYNRIISDANISTKAVNLTIVGHQNCQLYRTGSGIKLSPTANDPWIILEHEKIQSASAVIWFELQFSSKSQEPPSIYLDYGDDFSELHRYPLEKDGRFWTAKLSDAKKINRIRFDPDEKNASDTILVGGGLIAVIDINNWNINDGQIYLDELLPSTAKVTNVQMRLVRLEDVNYHVDRGSLNLIATSADPKIIFEFRPLGSGLANIWFDLEVRGFSTHSPAVYLDYGSGFSEQHKVLLSIKTGLWTSGKINSNKLYRIRLDPVENNYDVVTIRSAGISHFKNDNPVNDIVSGNRNYQSTDNSTNSYQDWLAAHRVGPSIQEFQRRCVSRMPIKPLISIIVPIYKVNIKVFKELVNSVLNQTYDSWQLCCALAYHEDDELVEYCRFLSCEFDKINLIEIENRGISENSNRALDIANGTYVVLLDHDDVITPDAIYEMASAAIKFPEANLFYSDKDMISEDGLNRFSPLFKPDWSPEMMLSVNYLTHFNMIKRERLLQIGGWDSKTDGAQDWDIFLRVAADKKPVIHMPKVLYNWRVVATSVAAGGLSVKPYAAQAQLLSVTRQLRLKGWSSASPTFVADNQIKIDWSPSYDPSIALIILGGFGPLPEWACSFANVSAFRVDDDNALVQKLNQIISECECPIILVIPNGLQPISSDWLRQMVGPLESEEINLCTGKLLGQYNDVIDAGWIAVDEFLSPIFNGMNRHSYSHIGSVDWFRNVNAASFAGMAFRYIDWLQVGGFKTIERPDLDFSARLCQDEGRIIYNPFAEAWIPNYKEASDIIPTKPIKVPKWLVSNNYFNSNLSIGISGEIELKTLNTKISNSHDYSAEAHYVAATYDFTANDIEASLKAQVYEKINIDFSQNKISRIAWLIPDFSMPFYGGILTILRTAEYMRINYNVCQVFVGIGATSVSDLREAIARAYPELAQKSSIYVLSSVQDINEIGIGFVDASICTLWTTAYPMLRLRNVRQKFYFVQDYEPLFYPAGTTGSLAEASYRFGYKALCNTRPLADLYRFHGGSAFYFDPSVDSKVFNSIGRYNKRPSDPALIFSYARPGHPRNCFEIIAAAFKVVKAELQDDVRILTAGADWDPRQYGLDGIVEHLGLLDYEQTGELYRACDLGVVAMATRHPSYLPFELMACGAVTITNHSPYTDWLLRDRENCYLFELSRSSVASTIIDAISDGMKRDRIAKQAISDIERGHSDWNQTCEHIYDIILRELR